MTGTVQPDSADHSLDHPAPPMAAHEAPVNHVPEVERRLQEAIGIIESARPMPLSTALMIQGDPLLDLLRQASAALPDELRAARWLLRERDEYLDRVRLEGEEIVSVARSRAERMVERTEVVKSAEQRAQRIIADAEAEARRMRRETEDFCDARLASLEGILDRTRTVVATGRNRLQGVGQIDLTRETEQIEAEAERSGLFDQDFS